jgi:hypothetical protein
MLNPLLEQGYILMAPSRYIDGRGRDTVARIALGETFKADVVEVKRVEQREKFRCTIKDDDGDISILYLDIEIPVGRAELRILHVGK